MAHSRSKNKVGLFLMATAVVLLGLYLVFGFQDRFLTYLQSHKFASPQSVLKVLELILLASLAYLIARALRSLLFDFIFRLRRGYEAPTLARNIFSIV
ncbi:MAG TPA: hypothetical protein VN920_09220, partial [Pyrinomonadaceae bacterium]|nr:hypothetical protein [Pyrinomonadaceae bacterium]